jgi:hypothetical protein
LGIGREQQASIFAKAAQGGGVGGKVFEDGAVGVAAIEGDPEVPGGRNIGIEVGAEITDLLGGALAEAGGAGLGAVLLLFRGGGLLGRFGRSGRVAKGDGHQAGETVGSGEGKRSLEKALGAHEIGLEARTERVAAPSDARSSRAGAAQEGIVEKSRDGSVGRQFGDHGTTDHREDLIDR